MARQVKKTLDDLTKEMTKPKPDEIKAGGETEEKAKETPVEAVKVVEPSAPVLKVEPEDYLLTYVPEEHKPIKNVEKQISSDGILIKMTYVSHGTGDRYHVYPSGLVQNAHTKQYV